MAETKKCPYCSEEILIYSRYELVTVIGSNHFSLGDYITPDLFFQLQSLKEHMGIDSFANYQ